MQPPLTTEIAPAPKRMKRLAVIARVAAPKLALAFAAAGLTLTIINPPGIGVVLMFTGVVAYLILADMRLRTRSKAGDN
ncbi:MAG TPA: hypothetical protein VNU48_02775 [Burkholderiaceae bacterium]|nr:hypothetical protein [Burkholderiaceae bacterium]